MAGAGPPARSPALRGTMTPGAPATRSGGRSGDQRGDGGRRRGRAGSRCVCPQGIRTASQFLWPPRVESGSTPSKSGEFYNDHCRLDPELKLADSILNLNTRH